MMYIALVCIMIFFAVQTNVGFLQARNITNLINQAGYVAVMAIGMTLVLIIVHIDLSVGYVAGFCGAVAAILMTKYNINEWIAILIVLVLGLLIGLYQGLLVTKVGVPAFVTTLAGMFIFVSAEQQPGHAFQGTSLRLEGSHGSPVLLFLYRLFLSSVPLLLTSHVFPTQTKTRHQSHAVNDGANCL